MTAQSVVCSSTSWCTLCFLRESRWDEWKTETEPFRRPRWPSVSHVRWTRPRLFFPSDPLHPLSPPWESGSATEGKKSESAIYRLLIDVDILFLGLNGGHFLSVRRSSFLHRSDWLPVMASIHFCFLNLESCQVNFHFRLVPKGRSSTAESRGITINSAFIKSINEISYLGNKTWYGGGEPLLPP